MREVTEFDLRAPEFRHPSLKPEDFEFREDGKIVRKDRWENGIRRIVAEIGYNRREFEIEDVVARINEVFDHIREFPVDYLIRVLKERMGTLPEGAEEFPKAAIDAVEKLWSFVEEE